MQSLETIMPPRSSSREERPLPYWDDFESTGRLLEAAGSADSAVVAVDGARLAHLVSIMPYSEMRSDSSRTPSESFGVYVEAAGFLAMQHFNNRSGEVLPHLPERLNGCNAYLTMNMYDSIFSPIVASRKLYETLTNPGALRPLALLGAGRSAVSLPLSVLSGAYNIPHMNSCSTSSDLDKTGVSPTFSRTVPTNAVDAKGTVAYFRSLGVYRFGVIFTRDAYGSQFMVDLQNAADAYNMDVVAVSYEDNTALLASVRDAIQTLLESQLKYFFGVFSPTTNVIKTILREAFDAGIIGNPDYVWLLSETSYQLVQPDFYQTEFQIDDPDDLKVLHAISGSGVVLLDLPHNDAFEQAMSEMGEDRGVLDYFISKHDYPAVFENFDFRPTPSLYQKLNYDAVMAIGIALCDADQDFITSEELVQQVRSTQFDGLSGTVNFDTITGTRTSENIKIKVVNLAVDIVDEDIHFEASDSVSINLATNKVLVKSPFVYSGGSVQAPPPLPVIQQELNLIPIGARVFVWCLSCLLIISSFGFAVWTYRNRNTKIVRAAQPPFLLVMCFGTFLMALALIPMGLQEPVSQSGLNAACMSVSWLLVVGFSFALSSLTCKAVRLNKVFGDSVRMMRAEIQAQDAILPFVVIVTTNAILLVSWTLVDPVEWVRTNSVDNVDQFGRSVESYGSCDYVSEQGGVYFLGSLFVVNVLFVVFACYQSYLTRYMPSEFNEHYYLCLSMASILEGFLLGVPIVFLAHENPTASLTILALTIAFLCIAIQFPMFVSKLIIRRRHLDTPERLQRADSAWREAIAASQTRTSRPNSHTLNSMDVSASRQGQPLAPSTNSVEEIRLRAARRRSVLSFFLSGSKEFRKSCALEPEYNHGDQT